MLRANVMITKVFSLVHRIVRLIAIVTMVTALLFAARGVMAQGEDGPHPETLRAVYTPLAPFAFTDLEGEPDGFAVELLRTMVARTGMALTFQEVESVAKALAMIEAGEADLHPALMSTPRSREVVSYTAPILVATLSLYALKDRAATFDPNDLSGLRIGFRAGSDAANAAHAVLGAIPMAIDRTSSLLNALTAGTVDLVVLLDAAFDRRARTAEFDKQFAQVGPQIHTIPIGIAVSHTQPETLALLDHMLRNMKAQPGFDAIVARWFGAPPSWWTPMRMFLAYAISISTVVIVALTAFSSQRLIARNLLTHDIRMRVTLASRNAAVLELKNAQLISQNQEMQRLLQAVSHDLKSPMVTVRGFAGVLEDAMASGNEPLARDACRRIIASTKNLSGIIEGLHEFNRVDQKPVALADVDLNALIAEAGEMLAADIDIAKASIVVPMRLPHVRADETQLLRVLLNMILNALRHGCPEPGMTVEITATTGTDSTEIVVRDHGPGIPEAFQRDVFRLFRRLAPGQSNGNGIGLSIVARIAAKHGGAAWASSPEGGGAALHVTLSNTPNDRSSPPATTSEDAA
jgi:signal transduction histidine kinase